MLTAPADLVHSAIVGHVLQLRKKLTNTDAMKGELFFLKFSFPFVHKLAID